MMLFTVDTFFLFARLNASSRISTCCAPESRMSYATLASSVTVAGYRNELRLKLAGQLAGTDQADHIRQILCPQQVLRSTL